MASAHDLRRIGRIVAASLDARDPGADAGDLDLRLARLRATAEPGAAVASALREAVARCWWRWPRWPLPHR